MPGKSQKLRHQEERLRRKLSNAKGSSAIRSATREYMNSFSARFVAVQEVAALKKFKLADDAVQTIARELSVWEPTDEDVFLHPVEKPNQPGDFRFLLNFGPLNRARQVLVRNTLKARWKIHPDQTVFNGGREKAIKLTCSHYRLGFRHVFELDVYHCFRSFDKDGMSSYLSLPERVVTSVLSGDELNIALSKCYEMVIGYTPDDDLLPLELFAAMESDWEPVRSGLTEGSMVSPFAAELLLAWVLDKVPDGAWHIVNYADNFLCLCENEEAASALTNILRELLHEHPAGPLNANLPSPVHSPSEAFQFLGYWLVPESPIGLRPYWGEKTNAKARRLRKNAYKSLCRPSLTVTEKKSRYRKIEKGHKALVKSFPSWTAGGQFHIEKMAKIRDKAGLEL